MRTPPISAFSSRGRLFRGPMAVLGLALALVFPLTVFGLSTGCGESSGVDGGPTDTGRPIDDAGGPDTSIERDTGPSSDAAADTGAADTSVAPDAGPADSGIVELDAAMLDGGTDAAMSDGGTDAGTADGGAFVLPGSCADDTACGPDASCDTGLSTCICDRGALPCGGACCPLRVALDVEIGDRGGWPEIVGHADGTFIGYRRGSDQIRLARVDTATEVLTTSAVTSSSNNQDDFDLIVDADGTQHLAVHRPGSGRSGFFTLQSRAGVSGAFTETNILPLGPATFAFSSAASLARTPDGDLLALTTRRVGDGQMGLLLSRYDTSAGSWSFIGNVLTGTSYSQTEIFPVASGFFILARRGDGDFRVFELDATGSFVATLASSTRVVGATLDGAELYTAANRDLRRSDLGPDLEALPVAGAWLDLDMALDADGNPAIAYHDASLNRVVLSVRMPGGGMTYDWWPESVFFPGSSGGAYLTLDLERLPSGDLALAGGERTCDEPLRYLQIAR